MLQCSGTTHIRWVMLACLVKYRTAESLFSYYTSEREPCNFEVSSSVSTSAMQGVEGEDSGPLEVEVVAAGTSPWRQQAELIEICRSQACHKIWTRDLCILGPPRAGAHHLLILQLYYVQQGVKSGYGCWEKEVVTSHVAFLFPCPEASLDCLPSTKPTSR